MPKNNDEEREDGNEGTETGHPPLPNATPATAGAQPEGMVLVSKKMLEDISKKIEMLEAVADPTRKTRYQIQHAGPLGQVVRIRRLTLPTGEKRYVLATKLIENEFYQNPTNGAWIERQRVEVIFEDATKEIYDYKPFSLNVERIEADVLQSTKDMEGREILVVQVRDGSAEPKKLTIDSLYVN